MCPKSSPDPQAGHEENDFVGGKRIRELPERTPFSLPSIVDILNIVVQTRSLLANVNLNELMCTMSPPVALIGTLSNVFR